MTAKSFEAVFAEVCSDKKDITRLNLKNFWRTLGKNHRERCGVYILVAKGKVEWTPLYVGMTMKTFGARLNRHSDAGSFKRFLAREECEKLGFFLLGSSAGAEKLELAIEALEIACVKRCLDRNPGLYNKQLVKETFVVKKAKNVPKVDWLP